MLNTLDCFLLWLAKLVWAWCTIVQLNLILDNEKSWDIYIRDREREGGGRERDREKL